MADEGYNDSIFVQVPEDNLRCPICLGVARDPVLTACGHLFCQKCFQKRPRYAECITCSPEIIGNLTALSVQLTEESSKTMKFDLPTQAAGAALSN